MKELDPAEPNCASPGTRAAGTNTLRLTMNRRQALKVLGVAVSLPVLAGLSGEGTLALGRTLHARLPDRGADYSLQTLSPRQNETVKVIVDLIIPETDTPGALAVRVHEFIDIMLTEILEDDERKRFLEGLAKLDEQSRVVCGKYFAECDAEQRTALLQEQEAEAIAEQEAAVESAGLSWGRRAVPRDHFFHEIKWLTLFGYYTSEAGMTGELGWQMLPGSYSGCDH